MTGQRPKGMIRAKSKEWVDIMLLYTVTLFEYRDFFRLSQEGLMFDLGLETQ